VRRNENGGSFVLRCERPNLLFSLSRVLIAAPQITQIMLCEMFSQISSVSKREFKLSPSSCTILAGRFVDFLKSVDAP
jgi:hypothetical protein